MMAESLLTPEELEALAESVDSGDLETDTGFNMQARVVKHELASEDSTWCKSFIDRYDQ